MPPTASTSHSTGSAERWGPLWGARAEDWAVTEELQRPGYEEAIRRVGLAPGRRVLDLGCGAGAFLALCSELGASPSGIDASNELLDIARRRLPGADLRQGDMQFLPYADDEFDLVTSFTSIFFAADVVATLREAARVGRPGAQVVVQVWGPPEGNDLEAMKAIMRPFLPARPADASEPPPLWQPGVLEELASAAGLSPAFAFDFSFAYEYSADGEALGRLLLAPAGLAALVDPEREPEVRGRIVEAMAPYRTPEGGYRLTNEMHYLVATVVG